MPVPGSAGTNGYRMQPRINLRRHEALASLGETTRLVARDEKPHTISSMAIPISLGITIPAVIALGVLIYLHRRNVKRQRMEDSNDPHRSLDFGLNDGPMPSRKKKSRKSILMGAEKPSHKTNQLSMDMNLESPYLLPPQVQGSHDSVNTLTRGYAAEYDPYRMVNSECGSIRSFNKETGASVYAESTKRASVVTGRSVGAAKMPPRQGSLTPKTPLSATDKEMEMTPIEKDDPFATPPAAPEPTHQGPVTAELKEPILPVKPIVPEIGTVPYPDDKPSDDVPQIPDIQEPPPAVAKSPEDRVGSPPNSHEFELPSMAQTDGIGVAYPGDSSHDHPQEPSGLGLNIDLPQPMSPLDDSMFTERHRQESRAPYPLTTPNNRQSKESDYGDHDYQPQIRTTEYYGDYGDYGEYDDYGHGRSEQRAAPPAEFVEPQPQQGLGVPQQENKRLSVGLRPLPPDDVTESEDPEYRANRIRSFYKEYFDDSKEAPPPMPAMPDDYYGGQYYEDYDEQYLGEAAYFDPETNAFVMPYAQPVHRRAMTPPPGGRRGPPGPGPRGPPGAGRGPRPHGPHGSLGGMSLPGGPRSRAGSAWGSRAPSSLGPRPDSSASARLGRQTPRKNLPPPAALSTLPTPSKLKDDSFAIFNAADFAPPESFSERAAGRSQSPLGERRPYSPKVPASNPLASSYDELNALPSPHMMRKSSTFTGLDFMPPKKFKDQDTMSDAGSIRSNQSGMSSTAASAIRMGAGRVSRLPGDTVFTQQSLSNELKPQWGMRP